MRVLILEDDPWIADLLKQIVQNLHPSTQIESVTRLADALDAWKRQPAQLVIADWNLPDGPGTSLLEVAHRVGIAEPDRPPLAMQQYVFVTDSKAEAREAAAPWKRKADDAEKRMDALTAEIESLDQTLSSPDLAPGEIADLMKKRAALIEASGKAEQDWLEASEAYEAAISP